MLLLFFVSGFEEKQEEKERKQRKKQKKEKELVEMKKRFRDHVSNEKRDRRR